MDGKEYRSMDLIWRIQPEAAHYICQAFGSAGVVLYEFHCMKEDSELDLFLCFADFMGMFFTSTPEEYLTYKNADEALDAYQEASVYLREHNIPERIKLFNILAGLVITYEFGDEYIQELDHYDPKEFDRYSGFLEYLGSWLGLSKEEIHDLASKEFQQAKLEAAGFGR